MRIEMEKRGPRLPFTALESILLRLPVESLVRFKCVSKFWCALFKSPSFISNHLSRSMTHASNYHLLLRLCLTPSTYKLFSLSHGSSLKHISIPIPNMSNTSLSQYIVSNSCNGLVCLYSEFVCGRDVFLCNPTTREIRLLPQSNLATQICDGMVLGVGMGHRIGTNDFKVVRVWVRYLEDRCKMFLVEEYSLMSDSWRTIRSANPWCGEFETSCFALYFKGVYYFWAKLKDSSTTILALNVGGGYFSKMHLPKNVDIGCVNGRYLGVLNKSMSLVCRSFCNKNANFDIWVKEDGGSMWGYSWNKVRTIEHSAPCVPFVFWKGIELLMKMYDMVRSYKVDTEENYKVKVEVEGQGIADTCEAIYFGKSLVSINPRK